MKKCRDWKRESEASYQCHHRRTSVASAGPCQEGLSRVCVLNLGMNMRCIRFLHELYLPDTKELASLVCHERCTCTGGRMRVCMRVHMHADIYIYVYIYIYVVV